jgi:hypothetical protein
MYRGWFGECASKKFVGSYHHEADIERGEAVEDSVFVEPDEGWEMYTGREFGCVHAEQVSAERED